jgi:signal transduction histidine kinase
MDFEVWSTPLEVEDQRLYLVALKDIADEKRRRALERIFFHDILNTAGGVVGYAALAQDATPEERDMLIDSLYGLSLRLIDEITSQQELLKAERNELALKLGTIDSRALLYMLAEAYRHHAVAEDRHIVVDEAVESVELTTDGTLLRRVLGNMVKNALEAIHPQETVTLRCVRWQDEVVFSVHNPGVIPERVRLQIFQRSFSTKAHDRGLGTYSMKLLTEQYLQGHVSFTTNPDDGTTFYARLPITRSDDMPGL